MAILLNGFILPIGGVASERVYAPAACTAGFFPLNLFMSPTPMLSAPTSTIIETVQCSAAQCLFKRYDNHWPNRCLQSFLKTVVLLILIL